MKPRSKLILAGTILLIAAIGCIVWGMQGDSWLRWTVGSDYLHVGLLYTCNSAGCITNSAAKDASGDDPWSSAAYTYGMLSFCIFVAAQACGCIAFIGTPVYLCCCSGNGKHMCKLATFAIFHFILAAAAWIIFFFQVVKPALAQTSPPSLGVDFYVTVAGCVCALVSAILTIATWCMRERADGYEELPTEDAEKGKAKAKAKAVDPKATAINTKEAPAVVTPTPAVKAPEPNPFGKQDNPFTNPYSRLAGNLHSDSDNDSFAASVGAKKADNDNPFARR